MVRGEQFIKLCKIPNDEKLDKIKKMIAWREERGRGYDWQRAFINACHGGNLEIIKVILDAGKLNDTKFDYSYGIEIACRNNKIMLVRFLIERTKHVSIDSILFASGHKCLPIIKLLFENNDTKYDLYEWNRIFGNAFVNSTKEIVNFLKSVIPKEIFTQETLDYFMFSYIFLYRHPNAGIISEMIKMGANGIEKYVQYYADKELIDEIFGHGISYDKLKKIKGTEPLEQKEILRCAMEMAYVLNDIMISDLINISKCYLTG